MSGRGESFTCARCGGHFIKAWTDEEAAAEYQETQPTHVARGDATETVCDGCYVEVMEWAKQQGLVP